MDAIRYDGQVAVVTGAGNGLGKYYATFLASRGAQVVVNDIGGDIHGDGKGRDGRVADLVVAEIQEKGGKAVASYDTVQQGAAIIQTAIDHFGRIDILVNNAGILRDTTLRKMNDKDWDVIMDVHLYGTMATSRAAWPHFKRNGYGRIVNTTSASGLFGNFGQSNYAAAKMAIVGLSETLAKEGQKYNIKCNIIAPAAGSRLTQTVWSPEMMEAMRPDWVVPLVGTLCHSSCEETGAILEAGAGHFSKIRWERSKGWLCRPQDATPDLITENIERIMDWKGAVHPDGPPDPLEFLRSAQQAPELKATGRTAEFQGRVAMVTGAGEGLGRAYSLELARRGAKVAVCDVKGAGQVVDAIERAGGSAYAMNRSVTDDADALIRDVIKRFGRIDVLINNAGILRDKSFANMDDQRWLDVLDVHCRATYKLTRAAWPYFLKQKYGRVVNAASTSGIYGNFGQANYAAAKCGIIGFSKAVAREGAKYNIVVNTIAPTAGTNLTAGVREAGENKALKPDFVAPIVLALCAERPPTSGGLFEAGAGWFAATRWQRAKGADFHFASGPPSVEQVKKSMPEICDFDNGQSDHPDRPEDGSVLYMANITNGIAQPLRKSKL